MNQQLFSDAEEIRCRILRKSWLDDFVTPDYAEYGISNIPATLSKIFNVTPERGYPFSDEAAKPLYEHGRRVILLLVDSLGYNVLLKSLGEKDSFLHKLPSSSLLLPLTSTFPSTTPTALTSLNTGLTPQQHAIAGYSIYLKQLGLVANMVNFSPAIENRRDFLLDLGLDPAQFMSGRTIYEMLTEAGYSARVVTRWFFRNTAFTGIVHRGAKIEPYVDTPDLFITLRRLLEAKPGEEQYIFAYWDTLDVVSHVYGPFSEEAEAEMRSLLYSLKTELIDRVGREAAKDTLLLITSDHGGHALLKDKTIKASDQPDLLKHLQIPPTGNSRAPYLYPKPNHLDSVRRYFDETFSDSFTLLESEEGLARGLFGFGEIAEVMRDRIGDLIALPHDGYSLFYSYKQHRDETLLKGGHGGLSENEMLVPLLAIPLDQVV
jgi:hypothetical protein